MTVLLPAVMFGVILLTTLAGCQRSVYSIRQNSLQSTADFRHAAGNKKLATKIYGNAFTAGQAEFDTRVLRAMQSVNNGHATPLVPRTAFVPSSSNKEIYKVVVVVDPARDLPGSALCLDSFQPAQQPPKQSISIRMSFCFQQSLVASVLGSTSRSADSSHLNFDALVSHLALRLFEHPGGRPEGRPGLRLGI